MFCGMTRRGCSEDAVDWIALRRILPYVWDMEVHFTPEREAQLAQLATKLGTDTKQLVADVVVRYLDEEARFLAAVEKGLAAADRGEFIEEEEMDARFEAMLKD
jgi:predicted transcriptional regulator